MNSDKLNWNRNEWGSERGKGAIYRFSSKKKNNNNSFNFDDNEQSNDWRLTVSPNRDGAPQQSFNRKPFIDDEKVWSRGSEVAFNSAENLLKEMSQEDYSGIISKTLLEPKVRILDFLNNEKRLDLNLSKTLIKVILKDSEENVFDKYFRKFLILILGTNFATRRIDSLINVDLATDPEMVLLELLIKFLKLCFETLPGLAYDIFYARVENLHLLCDNIFRAEISSQIMPELEELRMLAVSSCPFKCDGKENGLIDCMKPPDDFREMSIFPTRMDLLDNDTRDVFLRENKDHGAYKSVDHYLDVQFRLMREDFIRPLREGVREFKNKIYKTFNVRVYRNVKLLDSIPDKKLGIVHNIQLDQSRLTRINWSESKRFMNGALLCLSNDEFQTFTFAIVAKRFQDEIKQGILTVKFIDIVPLDYKEYTLLESTNLFESYRYVLARLQKINDDNFCMKDYLVYCKKIISLPGYLIKNMELKYIFKDQIIRPGNGVEEWPEAASLGMNVSQYQAFKAALSKEMTIIQGPPGTGKTYLGLEICHCLLTNVQACLEDFGPILVVCYTNHALDQFLTGISKFTYNIVRIGGGCKSDSIGAFSLLELKRRIRGDIIKHHPVYIELQALEVELDFRRNAFQSLLNLIRLQHVLSKEYYDYFVSVRIDKWLQGESQEDNIIPEDKLSTWLMSKIISEEIRRHINKIAMESLKEPLGNVKLDVDSDSEGLYYWPSHYGFTRVNNRTTKNLFKTYLKKQNKMSPREAAKVVSLDSLLITNRWRLYRYWRSLYVTFLKQSTQEKENEYDKLSIRLNELILEEDEKIMKEQDIIGMTTTGAAKYGKILERIGCKIIIVEEAAEVLESHVIASLNSSCQHLILIGDHKQLRPSTAVYELAKKYGLDLSLFERLINNELDYKTLSTQHRMRPEISEIIRFIYPELLDDKSVTNYPDVPSVRSNIFFFNHFEREEFCEDILSYSNPFEAELVLKVCRHLMGNGVAGNRITILTLYSGQNYLLNSLMDKTELEGVRISVVDNYQGEENDIILLSLVRSNEYEQIGFLNIENRICVSLSRAKHGLYVFGNFDILTAKNTMWRKICAFLNERQLLAKSLNMFCQNHPKKLLTVYAPKDFDKYPDYGCEELCKEVLRCGHICPKHCHFLDRTHEKHTCMADCSRTCVNEHACMQRCHERCRPCVVQITKCITECGHNQVMACYKLPEKSDCKNPCEKILACTHVCTRLCGTECGLCLTKVLKTSLRCGHSGQYFCHESDIVCNRSCDYVIKCGHLCNSICGLCFKNGSHKCCTDSCKELLICDHAFRAKYSILRFPCTEDFLEECAHSTCRIPCEERCSVCTEPCQWKCKHKKCTRMCNELCNRDVCNEKCTMGLVCRGCNKEFKCYGVCGEKCQISCTDCNPIITKNGLYITLWTCGHSFEVPFMDEYMFMRRDNVRTIARKTCPTCGAIINKRSCFRYLSVVHEISRIIEVVRILITSRLESFEYSSYYRILHPLRASLMTMFKHYNVANYFHGGGIKGQDVLYEEYFGTEESMKHTMVYRYRSSVLLLYKLYTDIFVHVQSQDSFPENGHNAMTRMIEWLNPVNREFDDLEVDSFIGEYKELLQLVEEKKDMEIMGDNRDGRDKWQGYLSNIFMEGYTMMRGFICNDRRWFMCAQGHIYSYGECLSSAPQCPQCHPNILWPMGLS